MQERVVTLSTLDSIYLLLAGFTLARAYRALMRPRQTADASLLLFHDPTFLGSIEGVEIRAGGIATRWPGHRILAQLPLVSMGIVAEGTLTESSLRILVGGDSIGVRGKGLR